MSERRSGPGRTVAAAGTAGAVALPAPALAPTAPVGAGFLARAWRRFRRNRLAMASLAVFLLVCAFSFGAPLLSAAVTHQDYADQNLGAQFARPGETKPVVRPGAPPGTPPATYFLGADELGRDVLTRLAYGGRISLSVALLTTLLALVIGLPLGAVAGFSGGWLDAALMRFVDVMLSVPRLFVLILVSAMLNNNALLTGTAFYRENGWLVLPIAIAVLSWMTISRLIRGEFLSIRERDFVEAARVLGASDTRIIVRHILPNVAHIVIVWASLVVPALILTEAALSYLGFGVQIPTPSWGNMLTGATKYLSRAPYLIVLPGLMIYLTVLAVNLIGNALRDAFDVRLAE